MYTQQSPDLFLMRGWGLGSIASLMWSLTCNDLMPPLPHTHTLQESQGGCGEGVGDEADAAAVGNQQSE